MYEQRKRPNGKKENLSKPKKEDKRKEREKNRKKRRRVRKNKLKIPNRDISSQQLYMRDGYFESVKKFPEAISTGSISKDPVQIEGNIVSADIVQKRILKHYMKKSDDGLTFRVGTFQFTPGNGLIRKGDPKHENHGMHVNETDIVLERYLVELVGGLTKSTMKASGQWNYLLANWEDISTNHVVAVDVDVYLDRMGNVGFHKDSRGRTLFVNLTYDNEEEIQGPEWIRDHITEETGLTKSFPEVVKEHLKEDKQAHSNENDIYTKRLPKYGRVSFSDPSFYHTTPLGRRRIKRGEVDFHKPISYEPAIEAHFLDQRDKIDVWKENVANYPQASKTDLESNANWPEKFNTVNTQPESGLPEDAGKSISSDIALTRNRRLSRDLEDASGFVDQLAKESAKPRTFIRTWIRLVPKEDVEPEKKVQWGVEQALNNM